MAPVPAFPIPTPADKLPIAKMKVPLGFKVELYAANVFDARGLRQGGQGHRLRQLAVSGPAKIYALVDKGGTREVKTIAEKLMLPNGIEFHRAPSTSRRRRTSPATTTSRPSSTAPDAGDGLRQAPGRRAARLEVHQDWPRRQALRAGGRALQHLRARSREVRADTAA